jgi:hypothetical protein
VNKSKRIKALEIRVDALAFMTETLLSIVHDLLDKNVNKDNLDSGKWYKDKS